MVEKMVELLAIIDFHEPLLVKDFHDGQMIIANRHRVKASQIKVVRDEILFVGDGGEIVESWLVGKISSIKFSLVEMNATSNLSAGKKTSRAGQLRTEERYAEPIVGFDEKQMSDPDTPLGQYLNEIGMLPPLDFKGELRLLKLVEAGAVARTAKEEGETGREIDRAIRRADKAKDHFIRSNLRLVVSVARRYPLRPGMELLDLIQEGNLGLERAVDQFDWRKGFKFSTYATYWIRYVIDRMCPGPLPPHPSW